MQTFAESLQKPEHLSCLSAWGPPGGSGGAPHGTQVPSRGALRSPRGFKSPALWEEFKVPGTMLGSSGPLWGSMEGPGGACGTVKRWHIFGRLKCHLFWAPRGPPVAPGGPHWGALGPSRGSGTPPGTPQNREKEAKASPKSSKTEAKVNLEGQTNQGSRKK